MKAEEPEESDDDMVLSFDPFVFEVIYQPFVGVGLVRLRVFVLECYTVAFPLYIGSNASFCPLAQPNKFVSARRSTE